MSEQISKKHTLLYWINVVLVVILCIFTLLIVFLGGLSINKMLKQEIENSTYLLQLNVENVDANLGALESYLYQTFAGSEDIVRLETGGTEFENFMATQNLSRSLQKIIGWNDSLKFLFFYSPVSKGQSFIRVSADSGNVRVKTQLEQEVKNYINLNIKQATQSGRGYMLTRVGSTGYVVRFYKVRNSYIGMCLEGTEILEPLEDFLSKNNSYAFICDLNGNVISTTNSGITRVDIAQSGKLIYKNGSAYLQLTYLSQNGDFYVGTLTRATAITEQLVNIAQLLIILAVIFIAFVVVITVAIRKALCNPIVKMEQGMKQLSNGEWDFTVHSNSQISEYNSMINSFDTMVAEIKNLKIQNYENEIAIQKTQLEYLQMQINPHFYLNTLNIIYSQAQVKNFELIQHMALSLVEYSRYMFRPSDSLVTVQQEMEHVENYIAIQKIRFPDRLIFKNLLTSEVQQALIPPFVIQSFIENSVKYSVTFEKLNELSVSGFLTEINNELFVKIKIHDNGMGYDEAFLQAYKNGNDANDATGKQIGIKNVEKRLRLVFGGNAKLLIENHNGAMSTLIFPFMLQEEGEEVE